MNLLTHSLDIASHGEKIGKKLESKYLDNICVCLFGLFFKKNGS